MGSVCSIDDDDAVFVLFKVDEDVNVSSPSSQRSQGLTKYVRKIKRLSIVYWLSNDFVEDLLNDRSFVYQLKRQMVESYFQMMMRMMKSMYNIRMLFEQWFVAKEDLAREKMNSSIVVSFLHSSILPKSMIHQIEDVSKVKLMDLIRNLLDQRWTDVFYLKIEEEQHVDAWWYFHFDHHQWYNFDYLILPHHRHFHHLNNDHL